MLTAILFATCLLGAIYASPYDDFRSNFEFLSDRTNLAEPAYRLLENVQPRNFYVHLDAYVDEARFDGYVSIEVEVLSEIQQIVLHQNVVAIQTATVRNSEGNIVSLNPEQPFETDDYYEIIKINFQNTLSIGTYTIEINYLGRINENPLDRGFYRGYFYLNGEQRFYATTQFQPYHARKAFPCFDEPQFKSQFVISITRPTSFSQTYSNMAINTTEVIGSRTRETFYPTPLISAYLIAFHVSEFEGTSSTGTPAQPFQIISRPGATSQHQYAADIGIDITNVLSDYLRIQYYDMGQGIPMKNDHIALPDFPSGAMENWGMVNYREAYLLYDPVNTNLNNKIFIATIIAHEMGHKWFGNLVTCFWWSNLWLNESFASFFEYFAAHAADPSLELDSQFIVDYVHSALTSDASPGATPMNWTGVVTNPSISSHFSTTSYAKGASVLRMMEHLVGPDTFRNALNNYLIENAYELGTPEKLYDGFRAAVQQDNSFLSQFPGLEIGELFDTWVQTPGAPVVNVSVNNENNLITVTQSRYVSSGVAPNSLWQIPLTFTVEGGNFDNLRPTHILSGQSMTIPKPQSGWVIFNNQQSGYYRVQYDEENWRLIIEALQSENLGNIHRFNRAQIVNDVLTYLRNDDMAIELVFDIISYMKDETDYYVWAAALGHLEWIRRRLVHITPLQERFEEYLLEQLENVIESVGYVEEAGDSTARILNRMQILNFACNIGHEGCVGDSIRQYIAFKNNGAVVPVNSRRYVYCMGLRNGDRSDYDFLYNLYLNSENTADMVVILRALGCTRDEAALQHYLQQSMIDDHIRIHDKTNAFAYAVQGNPENIKVVLAFLEEHYEEIALHYGGSDRLGIAVGSLTTHLTDFDDILAFQAWLYSNQIQLGPVFDSGRGVITSSVTNLQWANSVAVDLHVYLRGGASAVIASIALLFTTLFMHLVR